MSGRVNTRIEASSDEPNLTGPDLRGTATTPEVPALQEQGTRYAVPQQSARTGRPYLRIRVRSSAR